jgi:hypothetical protein
LYNNRGIYQKSFKKPKGKTKMIKLKALEWNGASPYHPDVTFQSFIITPTVIEMWGTIIYRNGGTDLSGFIKLVVGKLDKTSTTENENIITKISPKQYKQETEPYWKVLQCHKII